MAVRQVKIGGVSIGLADIDDILAEVQSLGIDDAEELKRVLFEKIRLKNWIPSEQESEYEDALLDEYRVFTGEKHRRSEETGTPEIRVYGPGCARCAKLDTMVIGILSERGLSADYRYVKDIREIAALKIVVTPAMTINGKVVLSGTVPGRHKLEKIILEAFE